ncbi:hypothetical protein GCM10007938_42660 [Vibrio zhanjiangensis]|uniref:Uncharacterized protein n=1 Tax=Vibrio zhanjiangensis TaxID=1046128 RepID=A0ABQ6F5G4_9VIBR|nr:hypothetical protein GCM10007938_42660 [Vibrio zhanjiangensis]
MAIPAAALKDKHDGVFMAHRGSVSRAWKRNQKEQQGQECGFEMCIHGAPHELASLKSVATL